MLKREFQNGEFVREVQILLFLALQKYLHIFAKNDYKHIYKLYTTSHFCSPILQNIKKEILKFSWEMNKWREPYSLILYYVIFDIINSFWVFARLRKVQSNYNWFTCDLTNECLLKSFFVLLGHFQTAYFVPYSLHLINTRHVY